MDSALDEDESELSVLVLSVPLQVLSHVDSLLDKLVEVLGNLRGEAILLQDSEDLVSGNSLYLWDAVVVTEEDTDLRRGSSLLCELNDLLNKLVG